MNITINLVKTVFENCEGFYHDNQKESLSIKNGIKSVDTFFFMYKNYISKYVSNVGSGYDKDTTEMMKSAIMEELRK